MDLMKTDITFDVLIRAPREKVFNAMTTPKGLNSWFTKKTTKDDGKLHLRWVDWGVDKVTTSSENLPILEDKFPERFVYQWWLDHPTTVEMHFLEHEEGTVVKLRESGYEDSEEGHRRFEDCAVGWGQALTLLKFYCEHGLTY
jgi:uncharacterized protein YndB with AHSA1/START domain